MLNCVRCELRFNLDQIISYHVNHRHILPLGAYIQILFDDILLSLVAEFSLSEIALQVIQSLTRVEVHLRFPVHRLVVDFG